MNPLQVVVTAVLATLATLIMGIVVAWSLWPKTAEASAALAAHGSAWHTDASSHCDHFGGEHIRFGEAVLSTALELDDYQQQSLAGVTAQLEQWRAAAQATCHATDLTTLDGSLVGMQTLLAQSAEAMADLRPAINAFYAELDADQQATLRDFIHSHHGRRGLRHHAH